VARAVALAVALTALYALPAASFDIVAKGGAVVVTSVRACATVDGDRWCVDEAGSHRRAGLGLSVTLAPGEGGTALRLELINRSEGAVVVEALEPLRGGEPVLPGKGRIRALVDGWTMNILPQLVDRGDASGHGTAAVERGGRALAIGAASSDAEVVVEWRGGELGARWELGGVTLAPTTSLVAELWVALGTDLGGALARWAEVAFEGTRSPRPKTGWCSWYAMPRPGEAFILREASIAASLGLEVVQIDDGWQRRAGEWEANERFPRGMAAMAADLRAAGVTPGLWLSPFIAAEQAPVVQANPDWVLRDREGRAVRSEERTAWGGRVVALDPSLPGVQAWLAELARRVTHDWGYRYLKLDFVGWGISDDRSDRSVTPIQAYRAALAGMRAAAAPGTYFLGCDAPFAASVGLFDAIRTGPDASPEPPREAQTLMASSRRQHWRRAYALDADVVMVRADVSDSDALARSYFPVATDGALFSGDALITIDAGRRQLLAGAVAAMSGAAEARSRSRLGPRLSVLEGRNLRHLRTLLAISSDRSVAVDGGSGVTPRVLIDPVRDRGDTSVELGPGAIRLLLTRPANGPTVAVDRARPLRRIAVRERDGELQIGPLEVAAELLIVPPGAVGPLTVVALPAAATRTVPRERLADPAP